MAGCGLLSRPALNVTELNNMTPNMTASGARKDPELNGVLAPQACRD
jgi:hypothetical protein